LNVVYERKKSGWNAFVPDTDISVPLQPTRQDIERNVKDDEGVNTYLVSRGMPSTAFVDNPMVLRPIIRPYRVKVFTDSIDWLGPTIVLLSSWYFAAQLLVAWAFKSEVAPGQYNFFTNAISDLGATGLYEKSYPFHSPRWFWMDLSIGLLGAAMLFGSLLIFTEFRFADDTRERVVAGIGFGLLSLSGLGAIMVACVPENLSGSRWHLHGVGTAMTIVAGQLGIFIIGFVLRSIPDWLREFMIVSSLIVLLGGIAYAFNSSHSFGFGPGALERIIQYPQSLWLILFGYYISREHWRNGVTGPSFKFNGKGSPDKGAMRWALRRHPENPAAMPSLEPAEAEAKNRKGASEPDVTEDEVAK
jgi:hypothetical membrane protein